MPCSEASGLHRSCWAQAAPTDRSRPGSLFPTILEMFLVQMATFSMSSQGREKASSCPLEGHHSYCKGPTLLISCNHNHLLKALLLIPY